ncbi:MAG: hypothetical protein AAGD11_17155 [Planctomycetota bacterium]
MLLSIKSAVPTHRFVSNRGSRYAIGPQLIVLTLATICLPGCGGTSASQRAEQAKNLPKKQFEWGMERLQRALRLSRPSTADGLYTERKMTYELIEPTDDSDRFTAKVTVTTAAEFIHGRRKVGAGEDGEASSEDKPQPEDPLSDKSDELTKLLDLPGAGPQAPTAPAPIIEPRSLDSEAVFELAYLGGKWSLQTEPEHRYEKMWFEYAFPEP